MKARRVKKLDPAAPLGENAARLIRVRLKEMLSFAPKALKPGRTEAQHDMRIAAKRLRYVLEVTGFCFGDPADTARGCARELQDILGELRDCDEMLPRVQRHLEQLDAADRGLDALVAHLVARQELLFDRFTTFWAEQEEAGTWLSLEQAVDAHLDRALIGVMLD